MNRIQKVFEKGKAFIPFLTAGDPSLEITELLIYEMASKGADLIEIGIPFSDPVAEGPVIQEANERSLKVGTTTDKIFDMVKRVRERCDIPLAFMTYVNPVFTYGPERFMKECRRVGIDAVIIPDLPYEEKEEIKPYCDDSHVTLISMIAPTSKDRILKIAEDAEGFLYCVSSLGVTGERSELGNDISEMINLVRKVTNLPCAIGFGIHTCEQAAKMAKYADGVIVGSAIVKMISKYGPYCVPYVGEYVSSMKEAIRI